jgi:hypothetical protein
MTENKIITRTDFDGFDQARITELELAAGMTALGQRINAPYGNGMIGALSANGRWGYEKEGRHWVVIDKTEREPLIFESSLTAARRRTFEIDHPVHTVAREPRPMRFTIV